MLNEHQLNLLVAIGDGTLPRSISHRDQSEVCVLRAMGLVGCSCTQDGVYRHYPVLTLAGREHAQRWIDNQLIDRG